MNDATSTQYPYPYVGLGTGYSRTQGTNGYVPGNLNFAGSLSSLDVA
jgi:hypothetical protein